MAKIGLQQNWKKITTAFAFTVFHCYFTGKCFDNFIFLLLFLFFTSTCYSCKEWRKAVGKSKRKHRKMQVWLTRNFYINFQRKQWMNEKACPRAVKEKYYWTLLTFLRTSSCHCGHGRNQLWSLISTVNQGFFPWLLMLKYWLRSITFWNTPFLRHDVLWDPKCSDDFLRIDLFQIP